MSRWAPKVLETLGWVVVVSMVGLCITQWFGVEGRRSIAALQALTPWVLVWAAPIALAASLTRRHPLALIALVPVTTLLTLSYPIVFHDDAPGAAAGAPTLTIAYANVYYLNPTPDLAVRALLAADADVMVMVELATPLLNALLATVPADDYPYRTGTQRGNAGAISVWSRVPIRSGGVVDVRTRASVDATLDVGGRTVHLLAVHPTSPTTDAAEWAAQLEEVGGRATSSTLPTIVLGDFNASRWHPAFRALLDRGLRDAHEALGHGWSTSWPMDDGLTPPPFVRIDHALFDDGIAPIAIGDLQVPGSDHRGFVVSVSLTEAGVTRAG
jgi:endonuclease/exonuclease/phosphatase (EEP) superfamily protein YafD